jgi:hypothetical protein
MDIVSRYAHRDASSDLRCLGHSGHLLLNARQAGEAWEGLVSIVNMPALARDGWAAGQSPG